MFRIVDGMAYEGKVSDTRWIVTQHDLGNGHREVVAQKAVDWEERGPVHEDAKPLTEDEQAERDESNRKRAARRAKTRVRRLCKAQGLDTLLTLTYRGNQTDLELCKSHFVKLKDRLRKALGGWSYVAAFEPQKRGAWHVHVAIHRLPRVILRQGVKVKSWNVIRSMWRDIAGEWGGNVDVGGKGARRKLKSPAKCAAYLSKYILKCFEAGADWSKRYLSSRCEIPQGVRTVLEHVGITEARHLMAMAFEWATEGREAVTLYLSRFGDTFYVAGEVPS